MTPKAARNYMQQAFITAWASQTEIALDNQDFDPGDSASPWVRLSIQFNDGEQASIGGGEGNQLFRTYGFVFVQVFTRRGTATDANDTLADTALKIFQGKDINGIWFKNGRINSVPQGKEKWYQQNVVIEFSFDDIH